ncbi:MAG: TlpA disulfide reductase family protein [Microbacteriaceae bacterium]
MSIRTTSRTPKFVALAAAITLGSLLLSGCAADDGISTEWGGGGEQNYISGDGSVLEIVPSARKATAEFEGTLDIGGEFHSSELQGQVTVINFWYAGCPPCRVEAPDLETSYQNFLEQDVRFLGVNVRDTADTSLTFSENYGISYPSIMDINSASAQLAFAGVVPPNAVPTTLILDRDGRVAARILGIAQLGTLKALIQTVLDEG